ncbi:hypothetical protein [Clostridium acetobutylicum]|nr:hypothetical protein [Clostridium acetobutylicum]NYC94349.1 hypothetical protein [Clostridium acetobutylicum]
MSSICEFISIGSPAAISLNIGIFSISFSPYSMFAEFPVKIIFEVS